MNRAITVCIMIVTMLAYAHENSYSDELVIPPLLEHTTENNQKSFTLIAKESAHNFSASSKTPAFAYNDMSYLGPTIRFRNKDLIEIKVQNNLNNETTLHQHGLHLPAPADGNPFHVIKPHSDWTTAYHVKQQAGTYWYHPHRNETTGYQIEMGLSGLIIVDDEESEKLNIPKTYGVDDIPLIIQDKRIRNNKIYYSEHMPEIMMGNIGNTVFTNGAKEPELKATRSLLRIRVLNGSSHGLHRYYFSDRRNFYMIANDAGLLEKPLKVKSILVAPSERRELLVDISDLQKNDVLQLRANVHNSFTQTALHIRADEFDTDVTTTVPDRLVQVPVLRPTQPVTKRNFVLESMGGMMGGGRMMGGMMRGMMGGMLTINGKRFDEDRVDEHVTLNTTEIWVIRNPSSGGVLHSFHPHHGSFQVLSYNKRRPPPELTGWKDTVFLFPGDVVEIIVEFKDYTGKYVYHCHQLEHEDAGMMGVFEIVN